MRGSGPAITCRRRCLQVICSACLSHQSVTGGVPGVLECAGQGALMYREAQMPVRRRHQRVPHRRVGVRSECLHGLGGEIECHASILPPRQPGPPWETS